MTIGKKVKKFVKEHKTAIAVGTTALLGICVGVQCGKNHVHKQNYKLFGGAYGVMRDAVRKYGRTVGMAYGCTEPIMIQDMGKVGASAIDGGVSATEAYTHFIMIGKSR